MLKLYNTYSAQIEVFEPINKDKVTMYVCGPTVYDHPHLGHARCYITWDVLYRYLKFSGYNVFYCRNITDVDDKIINKAKAQNTTPNAIAKEFYGVFEDSMKRLNVLKPDCEPLATEHIKEMTEIINTLIEKGFAYESGGDVYFRVKKFPKYGNLSKQPIAELIKGARVETSEKKEDALDFALWKKDEDFGYESPFGKGRPGWHIECSAMSKKNLAAQIDIHAGGADLIFPHHENEIAQSECANGCQFTKYWLHNGFVTINKEKMSKSLNNFISIDSLLKSYNTNTIRLFILTNHYRMPVEFSDEVLSSAEQGAKRLQNAISEGISFIGRENLIEKPENDSTKDFKLVMDEDLNTSKALAILFELASKTNKAKAENDKITATDSLSTLIYLAKVLGFSFAEEAAIDTKELELRIKNIIDNLEFLSEAEKTLPAEKIMEIIIEKRTSAKTEKNYELSDRIRNLLDSAGITLKDNKDRSTSFSLK